MNRRFLALAASCLLAVPCFGQWDKIVPQGRTRVTRPPQAIAVPALPTASDSSAVLRPEQMPAVPPQVNFQHGQLSIVAQNSTLGDILRAVRNQTGAAVDFPANATERVAGNFGPGPARDVVASLLNGSHFNYVLLGSATDPDALEHVVLTIRSGGSDSPPAITAAAPPPAPVESAENAGDEQPEQGAEENLFAQDPSAQGDDQTPNPFGQPAADGRTPEQMLQDIQQRQQEALQQIQQKQQQLGINPNMQFRGLPPVNPNPPAPQQPQ